MFLFKNISDFGLTRTRIFLFLAVSLTAAFFEGFSIALFLPVLEYIEKGRDIALLADSSKLWIAIITAADFVGVGVSLASLLGAVLSLILLRVAFTFGRQLYSVWLTQGLRHHTRMNLFAAFCNARYSYFDTLATGKISNLITTEADRASGCFNSLLAIVTLTVVITIYFIVLLWLSVPLTLFGILFLFLAGFIVSYFVRHTRKLSYSTSEANHHFATLVIERIMAFRQMKLTGSTAEEISRVSQASQRVSNQICRLESLNARVDVLLEPIVVTAGLILFYFAVNQFHMELAQVGVFMLILLRLLPLSKEILKARQSMLALIGSFKVVHEGLRDARSRGEISSGKKPLEAVGEAIVFDHVTFTYPSSDSPALADLNFTIPAGKITALVGPSGAGKSTLLDMIPRLRVPEAGEIRIDDDPIENFDLLSLRRGISFVSQDSFIFNDTVRANISYAKKKVTDEEIWEALDKAKAREFVEKLPKKLDTFLGERGIMLSGGQRQRIALAQAFLRNVPILVLDEPTSALDSESELAIQESISALRELGKVTIIVIAHRLSTIRNADKIIVLQDGKVTREGYHEQLMLSDAWYSKVHGIQASVSAG